MSTFLNLVALRKKSFASTLKFARSLEPSAASDASPSPSQTSTSLGLLSSGAVESTLEICEATGVIRSLRYVAVAVASVALLGFTIEKELPAKLPEPSAASNASPSLFQTSTSLDLALRKKNQPFYPHLKFVRPREPSAASDASPSPSQASTSLGFSPQQQRQVSYSNLRLFPWSKLCPAAFESALEICEAAGAVCCLRRVAVAALNVDLSTEEMVPAAVRHLYDVAVAATNTDDSSITILTLRTPR
ncbi:hypothetical protein K438DRAFT_1968062 [Mycena galopus ATCC 62051]|nr:hypothetical protein K438DRAFT_1968062 [Mycena galopus ATCC 62051]